MTTSGISVRVDKDEVFARPPVGTLADRDGPLHQAAGRVIPGRG